MIRLDLQNQTDKVITFQAVNPIIVAGRTINDLTFGLWFCLGQDLVLYDCAIIHYIV